MREDEQDSFELQTGIAERKKNQGFSSRDVDFVRSARVDTSMVGVDDRQVTVTSSD